MTLRPVHQPTLPRVQVQPSRQFDPDADYCSVCMFYAQKAAWVSTWWPTMYGQRWMQYACERFLNAFTHTSTACTDRVVF